MCELQSVSWWQSGSLTFIPGEVHHLKFISISQTHCVDWNLYAPFTSQTCCLSSHLFSYRLSLSGDCKAWHSESRWDHVSSTVRQEAGCDKRKNRDSFPLWKFLYTHTMNTNEEKNMSFINSSRLRILLSMNVCSCSFSAIKLIHCFKKPATVSLSLSFLSNKVSFVETYQNT